MLKPPQLIIAFISTVLFCLSISSSKTSIAVESRPAWQVERARRITGAKFLWLKPEWIEELDSIREIIKKALASTGKGK